MRIPKRALQTNDPKKIARIFYGEMDKQQLIDLAEEKGVKFHPETKKHLIIEWLVKRWLKK